MPNRVSETIANPSLVRLRVSACCSTRAACSAISWALSSSMIDFLFFFENVDHQTGIVPRLEVLGLATVEPREELAKTLRKRRDPILDQIETMFERFDSITHDSP